jgi:hypothetical protein
LLEKRLSFAFLFLMNVSTNFDGSFDCDEDDADWASYRMALKGDSEIELGAAASIFQPSRGL